MKQYINYIVLPLLSTAVLFSACNVEDPEIPPTVNYRYVTSQKEITNIPDKLLSQYNLREHFLFSINNSIYFIGECHETPDGVPLRNTALYEYNTNTGKWEIAWYVSEEEIRELEQSEDPDKWEKIERLQRMIDILAQRYYYHSSRTCAYNGMGYIFADEMTIVYTPSTNEFTALSYSTSSYINPMQNIFSTSKGIFGISNSGSSELYQYSPQTDWKKTGYIPYELLSYVNSNSLQLFSQQENLYIWEGIGDYKCSIQRYSFPYTTIDKYNTITYPHDYGWTDDGYFNTSAENYHEGNRVFCINGKIYKFNSSNNFYEYDPISNNLSLILLKNDIGYSYGTTLFTIIGNKIYFIMDNQTLMEITF